MKRPASQESLKSPARWDDFFIEDGGCIKGCGLRRLGLLDDGLLGPAMYCCMAHNTIMDSSRAACLPEPGSGAGAGRGGGCVAAAVCVGGGGVARREVHMWRLAGANWRLPLQPPQRRRGPRQRHLHNRVNALIFTVL